MAITNKLPRTLTLKSRNEIDHLLKRGNRQARSFSTMVWERSDSFGYAILISGKIKGAVVRNRLKRLYREAIRLNRQTLQSPINLAVIVRQPTKEPKFEDINREISEFIDSINGSKG